MSVRVNGDLQGVTLEAGDLNVGNVDVASIAAGDNNIGNVDVASALPTGSNTIGGVTVAPATSGGLLISRVISAATTNATSAKGSAGQVYGAYVSNTNAAARYFKLYNKATAPTVGTDTPVVTMLIPPNSSGFVLSQPSGVEFTTGVGYALTTGVADADTAAVAANEIVVNLFYK